MFNEQFANMSVAALLQVATDTSNKINKLINTPFYKKIINSKPKKKKVIS